MDTETTKVESFNMKNKEEWLTAYKDFLKVYVALKPQAGIARHIIDSLIGTNIVVERYQNGKRAVYAYSHELEYYVPFATLATYFVTTAARHLDRDIPIKRTITDVTLWMTGGEVDIPSMSVPPPHIALFANGPADVIENRLLSKSEAESYHFTTKNSLRFGQPIDMLTKLILDRMFNGWSDNDPEKKKVIIQGLRNVAEVNSKNKILILVGNGGNGKSSYLKCARAIAGINHVVNLNIHQLKSESNLNTVTESTTLIAGDELKSSHRMSGDALSLCKSLAVGDPLTIPVKYQNDRTLYPRLCIIQASNTELRFEEQTNALRARIVYIHWTNTDFRELKASGKVDFDLDNLLKDKKFLEQLLTYVLQEAEYQETFYVPESMKQTMESQLEASDSVFQFYEYLHEMNIIDHNDVLPTSYLYELYKEWKEQENPSAPTLAKLKLTERLAPYLEKDGFFLQKGNNGKVTNVRLLKLSSVEWNMKHFESIIRKPKQFPKTSSFFKRETSTFNHTLKEQIANGTVTADLDNQEHLRVVNHLIVTEKNPTVMSNYGSIWDSL